MLFLLHLAGFVYGLFALLWVKLTNSGTDVQLPSFFKNFPTIFPESFFPFGDIDVETPYTAKPYLVAGGLVLYCGRYLLSRCRG